MLITERSLGILRVSDRESKAAQRDRYRVVEGNETIAIQQMTARIRGFVQRWVYIYREDGIGSIVAGKSSGAPTKLTLHHQEQFKQRLVAGPTESDFGVCTLRGKA